MLLAFAHFKISKLFKMNVSILLNGYNKKVIFLDQPPDLNVKLPNYLKRSEPNKNGNSVFPSFIKVTFVEKIIYGNHAYTLMKNMACNYFLLRVTNPRDPRRKGTYYCFQSFVFCLVYLKQL